MKRSLYARLADLERVRKAASVSESVQFDSRPVIERMRAILRMCGIEQHPMESLAEAFCRALGISGTELRARLQTGNWHTVLGVTERGTITRNEGPRTTERIPLEVVDAIRAAANDMN